MRHCVTPQTGRLLRILLLRLRSLSASADEPVLLSASVTEDEF